MKAPWSLMAQEGAFQQQKVRSTNKACWCYDVNQIHRYDVNKYLVMVEVDNLV